MSKEYPMLDEETRKAVQTAIDNGDLKDEEKRQKIVESLMKRGLPMLEMVKITGLRPETVMDLMVKIFEAHPEYRVIRLK